VERTLLAGAVAQGFGTDLWTLPRIAEVTWRLTGVSYHPGHVWRLLRRHHWEPAAPRPPRHRAPWSCQGLVKVRA